MADMNQLLVKQLTAADFSAERHVRDLSALCVGSSELQQHRRAVESIAEQTDTQLKSNVYEHYGQFIETARQVRYLEGEMKQLTHHLAEQRHLMTQLLTHVPAHEPVGAAAVSTADPGQTARGKQNVDLSDDDSELLEERRQQLLQLLDRMEGGGHVRDLPQRHLVLDTELLAVAGEGDGAAVSRVRGCLLSDSLLLAAWLPERRGAVRYRFHALHQLDSLALVNVRRPGSHTFKLLLPPGEGGVKVFQCASAAVKQQWIDTVHAVKRRRQRLQRREMSARRKRTADAPSSPQQERPQQDKLEMEDELLDDPVKKFPKWLSTAPEYLSELVVEQRFESALELLLKARQYLHDHVEESSQQLSDFHALMDVQRVELLGGLLQQLGAAAGSGLSCHEHTVSRSLRLLERLGAADRAARLLLRRRSQLLRHQLRQLRVSCSQQLLPRRLVQLVMACVVGTARLYCDALSARQPCCLAALVVWVRGEAARLLAAFSRHVFSGAAAGLTLTAAAAGLAELREQAAALTALGLDVSEQLSAGLRRQLTRAVSEARQQQLEAVRVRAAEDQWLPGQDGLTANTLQFRAAFLQLVGDVARLGCEGVGGQQALADVMVAQLSHVQRAVAAEQPLALQNAGFLLNQLLPQACRQYKQLTGEECSPLLSLRSSITLPDSD